MLSLGLRLISLFFCLFALGFGFTAIFAPWHQLKFYDEYGNFVSVRKYLYRIYTRTGGNYNETHHSIRLYTRANQVCNNRPRWECNQAMLDFQVGGLAIGLIVAVMFLAIVFAILTWVLNRKSGMLTLILVLIVAMSCITIIAWPLAVEPFIEYTYQAFSLYVGFWFWLILASLSIWLAITYFMDSTDYKGSEFE